jgi:predicted SAM-dependent methyltransferase
MTSVTQRLRLAGTSRGLRHALKLVQLEWTLNLRHRRSVKKLRESIKGKSELRLHLGCGLNLRPDWINIDLFAPNADAQLDLREDWPFTTGSVSRVYSEHVFEHFEYPVEVRHFLAETLRVLKPGGTMDVGVPDTEWPLAAYGDDSNEYWRLAKEVWHPPYCETQLDHINYHFRQEGEHKYAWDSATLTNELQKAGFVSIERRVFDPSLDLESRRLGTLYMRARKST